MTTERINTIYAEGGQFVLPESGDAEEMRFSALEGQLVGIGHTKGGELGFCFWERDEDRTTILAVRPSLSLGLLMPMAAVESFVGKTVRLEAYPDGGWTGYNVIVEGRRTDWIRESIPPAGTFRDIFIENLTERINFSAAR